MSIHDQDGGAAARLAEAVGGRVCDDLAGAGRGADVIVTTTPARRPFLDADMVAPGALVCAYGADAPGKQKLALDLLERADVVVDVKGQAVAAGELQHAAAAGLEHVVDAAQELAAVLAGGSRMRRDDAPVVYDATGTAVQDAVAAAQLVDTAERARRGRRVELDA